MTPIVASAKGSDIASRDSRLIEHYLRFVLRDEGGPLRNRLHAGLAELGLKTGNPDHGMTPTDVQARIIRATRLPDYPMGLVTSALEDLRRRTHVAEVSKTSRGEPLYRLSKTRFEIVGQGLTETDHEDELFKQSVIHRLEAHHGHLSRDDAEIVGEGFVNFVGRMLEGLGEQCARRLIEERSGKQVAYPKIQDDLSAAVRGLPVELQDDACIAFEDALRHPSEEEAKYLYFAGQVYYIAGLLNVDPSLQQLQRRRFEETVLFLDTNILLALVHPQDESHTAVTRMASLCSAAGFSLVYSPRTADEFESLITAAETEFRLTPEPFDPAAAATFALAVKNPILRGWLQSFDDHRASWAQYRVRISGWRATLEHLGVSLHELPDAPKDERNRRLRQVLSRPRQSRNGETRDPKRPKAIEHDVEVVSGIETLVKGDSRDPDPFGPRFWFITHDRHLVETVRSNANGPGRQLVMSADEWVQYISPFLSADTSTLEPATTFAGLLSSRFLPSLGKRMSLADLRVFAVPEVAKLTDGLSEDEACRAISDAHLDAVTKAADTSKIDERAIARLAQIAENRRKQMLKRGEVVPASRLESMRTEREANARETAEKHRRQAEKIEDLKTKLQSAEADRRSSIVFIARELTARLSSAWSQLKGWTRVHRGRATIFGIVFLIVVGFIASGIGGILTTAVGLAILIVTGLATDFDQVKKNLRKIFDRP